jgi:hypothetical protein
MRKHIEHSRVDVRRRAVTADQEIAAGTAEALSS